MRGLVTCFWFLAAFVACAAKGFDVTTLRDSGAGSLRAACAVPGPLSVRFAVDGTLRLSRDIVCSSDKTISGTGRRVKITGGALRFVGAKNVVVEGLCFSDTVDDGVEIRNTRNATVRKCSFVRNGDGALDVVRGSREVTISKNLFFSNVKTSLVGNTDSFDGDRVTRVRYEGNHFRDCSARMPRVRYAQVTVCANVFTAWKDYVLGGSAYGVIRASKNYFRPGSKKMIVKKFHPSLQVFAGVNTLYGNSQMNDASRAPSSADSASSCASVSESIVVRDAGVGGDWCR